ncbi:MAG: hypothetical protein ACK53E_14960, partial [Pseudanabaena sp.]
NYDSGKITDGFGLCIDFGYRNTDLSDRQKLPIFTTVSELQDGRIGRYSIMFELVNIRNSGLIFLRPFHFRTTDFYKEREAWC